MGGKSPFGRVLDARLGLLLGMSTVLVAVTGIGLAVSLAPWFSVTNNALSDLGQAGRASAPVFNLGVTVSGLLGIGFAGYLIRRSTTTTMRLGGGLLMTAALSAVVIGQHPPSHPYHVPASVGLFSFGTYAMLVYGTGVVLAGYRRRGLVSVWVGIGHASVWFGWLLMGMPGGLAIPELIGIIAIFGWTLAILWRDRPYWLGRAADSENA